ncbi:hypothetical protein EV143_10747 [Flavobacterium chryseum]|uniref:hypothetical protein n=1 Tax=Flavobacterium sp. P3160 TaxID=2512113 RepID=UPI00106166C6|nr:hypothetical protein [Flavobacterium sp. P3160]TDO72742.1 hypothetical protein EV143_10747 [Flavobacterium sp. P3160]
MKKIYLMLIVILSVSSYGQSFNMESTGYLANAAPSCITYGHFDYYFFAYGIGSNDHNFSSTIPGLSEFTIDKIPNLPASTIDISMFLKQIDCMNPVKVFVNSKSFKKTIVQLITGDWDWNVSSGDMSFPVGYKTTKFTPIGMSLASNISTVCSGSQLDFLIVSPAGFQKEVYHWQYSLDNKATWKDAVNLMDQSEINNTQIPQFTIQQILGNEHEKYFDKQIFFRLGYRQDRPFTNSVAVTYLSCAPVAEYINYEAPQCKGDNIQKIEVFFDRKLKDGEDLSIIYVMNTDPMKTTPRFQNTALVTSFILDPATNLYKYSFPNLGEALENGNFYTVKYQARLNGQPMGSLQVSQQPFQYIDPAKMQFKITGQTQPTCFGAEDATIDIEILSGESPYNFYVDNVLRAASKIDNLHYRIIDLKANAIEYKIKVTDKNDCIEKVY